MAESYTVVWSGEKEKQEHDRQLRAAPCIEEQKAYPRRARHATKEDQCVMDLRNRWQIEKQST